MPRLLLATPLLVTVLACAQLGGGPNDTAGGCDCQRVAPTARPASYDRPRIRKARRPAPSTAAPSLVEEDEHPSEPRWIEIEPGQPESLEGAAAADAPSGGRVFFGLLHAHTFYSDGTGFPANAFQMARDAGLDFFGVTPHNHPAAEGLAGGERRDGILIANDNDLYDSDQPVTVERVVGGQARPPVMADSVQRAAAVATNADFVALFGQEFSSISRGNHVNVFQPPDVIQSSAIANGAFDDFFADLAGDPQGSLRVVQMNHPNVHEDFFFGGSSPGTISKMFNDYGFDDFGDDFVSLTAAASPFVALLEVLSGPATDRHVHPTFHYSGHQLHENDYYFYLIQGLHLSPSAGQDNHFETWGRSTPARMGVFAEQLTPAGLIQAMRENRTYATEDSDLVIEFSCNGEPMGSVLSVPAGTELQLAVRVADATDANQHYRIELFYGDVLPARNRDELIKWRARDGLEESIAFDGQGEVSFDLFEASGVPEFFYIRVLQSDSDRAWSAPIWINHPRPR